MRNSAYDQNRFLFLLLNHFFSSLEPLLYISKDKVLFKNSACGLLLFTVHLAKPLLKY